MRPDTEVLSQVDGIENNIYVRLGAGLYVPWRTTITLIVMKYGASMHEPGKPSGAF